MSLTQVQPMSADAARRLTDEIKQFVGIVWERVSVAYLGRAWEALGYTSWDAYCEAEFQSLQLRLPREERSEVVGSLRDAGMSVRAIAAATSVSVGTVHASLSTVQNRTVEANEPVPIIGVNGKHYSPLQQPTAGSVTASTATRQPHVAFNSGDNEWYTPEYLTSAARAVMGGIDLDPASSAKANEHVGALTFYTAADDGLTKPWRGRVWMNPPYSQPLVSRFCERMADEYVAGNVLVGIVLINNATETRFFQRLAKRSSAVCFPEGRVKFWHQEKLGPPLQGQAVLYLGRAPEVFCATFREFGKCARWDS